ncbi:hypothetical protein [Butyrivibrio sp. YAB3001]|uniref:hypothetical protein n=1 Tax=Butyrivibrio sp. YAB3001 TaxID=1520812 RepID=UPI0008F667EC|nr:hypothetical protein [Butyrivibrio sp. YAB3001]SFB73109.1 hypothetical protein SAMN02910398_00489 [Butyrivibrio sp. YAB3001]
MFFIRKEIKELLQCKKVYFLLLFCVVYQFILNVIAKTPLLPIEESLYLASFITACVSAEFVYMAMIGEMKTGTMELILLSRFKAEKFVFAKIFMPSVMAIVVTFLGIRINNLGALFIDKAVAITNVGIMDNLMIIMAAVICSLSTLFMVINMKQYNTTTLTCNVIGVAAVFILFHFLEVFIAKKYFIVIAAVIMIVLYIANVYSVNHKRFNHEKAAGKQCSVFTGREDCWWKSICMREYKKLLMQKKLAIKLIVLLIGMITMNSFSLEGELYRKIFIFTEMYLMISVITLDLYFELAKQEIYAKTDEILQLAGISKKKNLFVIFEICYFLGAVIGILLFGILYVLSLLRGMNYPFRAVEIIGYFVMLLLSFFICYGFILRGLKNVKEEHIVRISIYGLCAITSFLYFWLI